MIRREEAERLHVLTLGYLTASMKTSSPPHSWAEASSDKQAFKVVQHHHLGIFQSPGGHPPPTHTHTTDKWTGHSFPFPGSGAPHDARRQIPKIFPTVLPQILFGVRTLDQVNGEVYIQSTHRMRPCSMFVCGTTPIYQVSSEEKKLLGQSGFYGLRD